MRGTGRALTSRHRRPLRVKMISPAKTAADSPFWRSIKYSLFPPLGLAALAGHLDEADEVVLQDEHVEKIDLADEPDLVVIEAYVTSANRAYRYADHYRRKGAHVCLGGLHPTSMPAEAARHADSVFCGPGEDTWPAFLEDFKAGRPKPLYRSTVRTLAAEHVTSSPPARSACPCWLDLRMGNKLVDIETRRQPWESRTRPKRQRRTCSKRQDRPSRRPS